MAKKLLAPFYERLTFILVGMIALGWLVVAGKEILDPMLFGFLFAILLLPISDFFERRLKFPRSLAAFVSILLMVAFIGGIVYLVSTQLTGLSRDWPLLQNQVSKSVADLQDEIHKSFHYDIAAQTEYIDHTTQKVMAQGGVILGSTLGALSSLLLFYVFIIIFTFFILLYRKLLLKFLLWVFEGHGEEIVFDVVTNVQTIIRKYIIGLLIQMVIVSAASCLVFGLLGIKYAMLLGILTGLFNIIPYIGIFTALCLSSLITFATGAVSMALVVAVSVVIIHALDSNVLLPLVVGSKVKLNALITFLGVIIGEMLWGLSGMFLSIPAIAILKIIFDRIEVMKPWGFLLGGEYEYKPAAEKAMKTE
ncbi:AI-2E family transporter [Mucilaginibacter myungsuensis]|uniref:AI-2E family transporter n=1 Tax=Mucilaginibacter myungsuensis TaxID=649104 RepID=A0A929KXQ9_9SPHI|nr:AI-2E family transporter [Mucilaginibacter myungsuensis]MBE9663596.1 AI-2E family transporter [Mucilaginibacter myungsuensis]MDN3599080.1 AI-2E family transporter [Mucilaginibacter myungsuensis]